MWDHIEKKDTSPPISKGIIQIQQKSRSNLPLVNNVIPIPASLLPQEKTPCPAL